MNIQERIEALETEFNAKIKALKAEVQRGDEFPRDGNEYWYIDDEGGVFSTNYDNHYIDRYHQTIGNIFRTEEQANFIVEKLKVEAELRKFSRRFVAHQSDCLISYEHGRGELEFRYSLFADVQGAIYFESKEKAQQAIDTVGADRIKKYIFGVGD